MSLACVGVWSNSDSLGSWWFAEIETREETLCSERPPKTGCIEKLPFLFVIYSEQCSLSGSCVFSPELLLAIFCRHIILPFILLKLVHSVSGDFLTGFISTFTVLSPHCFLHANVDYVILLIVFKHGCQVITIALPLCPNIILLIKDFEKWLDTYLCIHGPSALRCTKWFFYTDPLILSMLFILVIGVYGGMKILLCIIIVT